MSVKQPLTAEQLWELPEAPGKRHELVKGELVEVPGAGALHGLIVGVIYRLLAAFVDERGLGYAFGDGVGYILGRDPDLVRIPDASYVARERVPEDGIPEGFWPIAPDLAVEVVSPHDRAEDIHGKVREYLAAGTRLVWVLWPRSRAVTVHDAGGETRELDAADELDGGDVLPGFRVRVADLLAVGR